MFVALVLMVAVFGGVMCISQYSAVAENRQEIRELKGDIVDAKVYNVDLKNDFYQIVDPAKLELMAGDYGLVLENNPEYMNINQWVSDSSH